jgi:hypothetical protein
VINWLINQRNYARRAYNSIDEDIKKDEKRKAKGKEPFATPEEHLQYRQFRAEELEIIEFLIQFLRERIEFKK